MGLAFEDAVAALLESVAKHKFGAWRLINNGNSVAIQYAPVKAEDVGAYPEDTLDNFIRRLGGPNAFAHLPGMPWVANWDVMPQDVRNFQEFFKRATGSHGPWFLLNARRIITEDGVVFLDLPSNTDEIELWEVENLAALLCDVDLAQQSVNQGCA